MGALLTEASSGIMLIASGRAGGPKLVGARQCEEGGQEGAPTGATYVWGGSWIPTSYTFA